MNLVTTTHQTPTPEFDYLALPPEVAVIARTCAVRIRDRLSFGYLETGRDLIAAKAAFKHGHFAKWLEAEFGMSVRSATRYMAAARFVESNSATVADLPAETMKVLSAPALPDEVRASCLERVKAGERLLPAHVIGAAKIHRDAVMRQKQIEEKQNRLRRAPERQDAKQRRLEEEQAAAKSRHQSELAASRDLIALLAPALVGREAEAAGFMRASGFQFLSVFRSHIEALALEAQR